MGESSRNIWIVYQQWEGAVDLKDGHLIVGGSYKKCLINYWGIRKLDRCSLLRKQITTIRKLINVKHNIKSIKRTRSTITIIQKSYYKIEK